MFIETVLIDLAEKDALDEVFARCIDCWTQSTSFTDAFTSRAQKSSLFTRPAVLFIKARIDKTVDEWCLTEMNEELPSAEVDTSSTPSSLPLDNP